MRLIIDDSDAAAPKIYGALPDVGSVLVRRHKAFETVKSQFMTEYRFKLFELIKENYLKLYPEYARLLSVLDIPKFIRNKLMKWGRKIQRVNNPGLFCSELVTTIYQGVKSRLLSGDPGDWAPADFETSMDFEDVDCIREVDFKRRYGYGIHKFANLLYIDATPIIARRSAEIAGLVDLVAHLLRTKGRDMEKVVCRPLSNDGDLEYVKNWGFFVGDRVFDFVKCAPACFAECPHRKIVNAASEERELSLLQAASNVRCSNIFQCSWFTGNYYYSLDDINRRRDELDKKLRDELDKDF